MGSLPHGASHNSNIQTNGPIWSHFWGGVPCLKDPWSLLGEYPSPQVRGTPGPRSGYPCPSSGGTQSQAGNIPQNSAYPQSGQDGVPQPGQVLTPFRPGLESMFGQVTLQVVRNINIKAFSVANNAIEMHCSDQGICSRCLQWAMFCLIAKRF